MQSLKLTQNHGAAGGRVVHALQGGGPGLSGRYCSGLTWCGVEKRCAIALAETAAPITCKVCLALLAGFERAHPAAEKIA